MEESAELELFVDGAWCAAGELAVSDPAQGRRSPCWLRYHLDHVLAHRGERGPAAFARRYPVGLEGVRLRTWPAFLDDVAPAGAARRWWVDRLGLGSEREPATDLPLLRHGAVAPVGNLRVAGAVPERGEPVGFERRDVIERDAAFLDHAARLGAAVGGATGAGGEAPKVLLREDHRGRVWLDAWQDDDRPDRHWLVKFPRGDRTERDRLVLRSEFAYARTLEALGFPVVGGAVLEEATQPSLWLPRFDRQWDGAHNLRYPVESLASLAELAPGSWASHVVLAEALVDAVRPADDAARAALIGDYVARDLLNVLLGNTDNHARNTSVVWGPVGPGLAPIYDLAPMKLDPEGIVRTTRWPGRLDGPDPDWRGIAEALAHLAAPEATWEHLRAAGARLVGLPGRLREHGCPEDTLDAPPIGFQWADEKLVRWGLA